MAAERDPLTNVRNRTGVRHQTSVRRVLSGVFLGLRRAYLLPVRMYRRFLSPLKPVSSCRFTPSCSRYAIDAVMEWGIFAGSLLALWRILRCNPFSRGGDDPVPTRAEVWGRLRSLFRR